MSPIEQLMRDQEKCINDLRDELKIKSARMEALEKVAAATTTCVEAGYGTDDLMAALNELDALAGAQEKQP